MGLGLLLREDQRKGRLLWVVGDEGSHVTAAAEEVNDTTFALRFRAACRIVNVNYVIMSSTLMTL
jgi:hypothetical protein